MSRRLHATLALALTVAGASACARSACPTTHFIPSASFESELTNWLTQPSPESADESDLLFSYTEADTMEADREPIYQVSVLEDGTRHHVLLIDAPRSMERKPRPQAVWASRPLAPGLAERIHRAAAAILVRTRYDPAPPLAASASREQVWCTDGFWAYAAAGQVKGNDLLAGEVYSPEPATEAGAIVALGRALHRYVQGRLDEPGLEAPLAAAESYARP